MEDLVSHDYNVKYPKASYGTQINLTIIDDMEVAIRTTIGVVAAGCICLYEDDQKVIDEFPACFLMLVAVMALSLVPFAGAALSHGASFIWGGFLGTIGVIIVIEILGSDVENITVPFEAAQTCIYSPNPLVIPQGTPLPAIIPIPPFNATSIFVDLPGDVADPSPYWLGVLIVVGTFFFVFIGQSKFFILGSVIAFDFYLATWYTATQSPLRPIPDTDDFFLTTRTMLIGVGLGIAVFVLPLPKLFPTFVPQPRFGSSIIFFQLTQISKKLSDNFEDIISLFEFMHQCNNKQQMLSVTKARILLARKILDNAGGVLRKLILVLKLSAQYEPMWLPLPFPHFITVNRLKEMINSYQALIIYEDAMLRSLENYASQARYNPEVSVECISLLKEFSEDVKSLTKFHVIGNPFFCTYSDDVRENIERHYEEFKKLADDHFAEKAQHPDDSISREAKLLSLGFHTYFAWCIYGVSQSVVKIEKLRRLPDNKLLGIFLVLIDWPLHLLGWSLEYFMNIFSFLKECVQVILLRDPYHERKTRKKRKFIRILLSFIGRHYSRFLGALIISFACLISFLFVLIDDWRTRLPTGTTVIIMAVASIDRDQPSGGFRNAILRLAGTTLGIASAFCVVIFFDDTPEDGLGNDPIIVSMTLFTLFGRLIMQNPKYMFFAYTFITTNIVLLFGVSVDFNTFIGFSGLRAVAIGIGISISTIFMVLWPMRASVRLKRRVGNAVEICGDLVLNSLTGIYPPKDAQKIYEKLLKEGFKQQFTRDNAEFEPDLFGQPFPVTEYEKIFECEKLLIRDSLILSEVAILLQKIDNANISEFPGMSDDFMTQLDHLFNTLTWRCKVAYADPYKSQLDVFNLQQEFFDNLPEIENFLQMGDSQHVGSASALIFCLFNIIEDIKQFNGAITELLASRLANSPPGIPLRIPYDQVNKLNKL